MEIFERQLELWGVELGREELARLERYTGELATYERANVIGTRETNRVWLDHVLDSLSCLLYEPLRRMSSLIDVGSGGGLPGIPLHLAVGFQRVCLVESTGKKAEFLRHVSEQMLLGAVEIASRRAEELGRLPEYRDRFEAATARAIAPLDVVYEYSLPLLEPGGVLVAMKGRADTEEHRAGERGAEMLGGEIREIIRVPFVPGMEHKERHLVVIEKMRSTPKPFPRKTGIPRKYPLGGSV